MDAPLTPQRDEEPAGPAGSTLTHTPPSAAAEQLSFVGRILALTYDDRGRCDGFVLELACGAERCFEVRDAEMESALHRALAARAPATILTAAAAPRRPVAILTGDV